MRVGVIRVEPLLRGGKGTVDVGTEEVETVTCLVEGDVEVGRGCAGEGDVAVRVEGPVVAGDG
jgi:hypothetical protein